MRVCFGGGVRSLVEGIQMQWPRVRMNEARGASYIVYPGRGALFGQLSNLMYNRLIHWVGLS